MKRMTRLNTTIMTMDLHEKALVSKEVQQVLKLAQKTGFSIQHEASLDGQLHVAGHKGARLHCSDGHTVERHTDQVTETILILHLNGSMTANARSAVPVSACSSTATTVAIAASLSAASTVRTRKSRWKIRGLLLHNVCVSRATR